MLKLLRSKKVKSKDPLPLTKYILLLLIILLFYMFNINAADNSDDKKKKPDIKKLINKINPSNPKRIRLKAIDELGNLKAKEAVLELVKSFKDGNRIIKKHILTSLGKIKDPRAVPMLINILKDKNENWSIIKSACDVLTIIKEPESFESLLDTLKYECQIERKKLDPPIRKTVFTDDVMFEKSIVGNIKNFIELTKDLEVKNGYINKLIKYMEQEKKPTKLKYYYAIILGYFGNKNVVPVLIHYLENSENGIFRERAARLLGRLGDKRAIEPLKNALKDNFILKSTGYPKKNYGYTIRRAAASSLIKLGIKVRRLEDGNSYEVEE